MYGHCFDRGYITDGRRDLRDRCDPLIRNTDFYKPMITTGSTLSVASLSLAKPGMVAFYQALCQQNRGPSSTQSHTCENLCTPR